MNKSLKEWFDYFEERTHEKHVNPDGYKTLFDEEKGYCQICIKSNNLLIHECCGDGIFWKNWVFEFAKKHRINKVITICTRSIIPYIRRMRGKILKKKQCENSHNGVEIFGIAQEGNFRCFPIWWNSKTEKNAYCIICEVNNEFAII